MLPCNYEDLLGVKYKDNGRTKEEGLDCLGLFQLMKQRTNEYFPDYTTPETNNMIVQAVLYERDNHFRKLEQPEEGCLVLMKILPRFHIGYMINDQQFIHILENRNVALNRITDPLWSRLIVGYYQWETK